MEHEVELRSSIAYWELKTQNAKHPGNLVREIPDCMYSFFATVVGQGNKSKSTDFQSDRCLGTIPGNENANTDQFGKFSKPNNWTKNSWRFRPPLLEIWPILVSKKQDGESQNAELEASKRQAMGDGTVSCLFMKAEKSCP